MVAGLAAGGSGARVHGRSARVAGAAGGGFHAGPFDQPAHAGRAALTGRLGAQRAAPGAHVHLGVAALQPRAAALQAHRAEQLGNLLAHVVKTGFGPRGAVAEADAHVLECFQPDDLARLLDAPEVSVRALTIDGHPVSVALLAREGGLDEATRQVAYEGDRIRGNLIPDLLTSQLRDPAAARPTGVRVMRIVTHHAVRSAGFGSRLLAELESEFGREGSPTGSRSVDYLGVSYGATTPLLRFWSANGYRTVHLSTTRNDASGEHSAVMLRPLSAAGDDLADRHAAWFGRRIEGVLSGALDDLDPDVARAALATADADVPLELGEFEWRLVASAADGPGLYETAPGPFRDLALKTLLEDGLDDPDAERLLVVGVLQNRGWEETAERLGYVSRRACMRALGDAYRPIVDRYGGEIARAEINR